MMVIGNCFAFIIIVMGTLLAAKNISNEEKQQFFDDILNAHNNYRHHHGSAKLKLSNMMCIKAKEIAESWFKASNTEAIQTKYGTNYVYITGESDDKSLPDANQILKSWYANETAYDYFEETLPTREINQFTQIVWQNTKKIGVEIIWEDNVILVLVIYSPAGNVIGQYMSNVLNPQELTWKLEDIHDNDVLKFILDIFVEHNNHRINNGLPGLILNQNLNKIAKKHVKEWLANRTSTLYDGYGTNYYQMPFEGVDKLDAAKIVSNWFETMFNYYRQYQPTNPNVTNPLTKKIGVGVLIINGTVNVVAIYDFAGNQP